MTRRRIMVSVIVLLLVLVAVFFIVLKSIGIGAKTELQASETHDEIATTTMEVNVSSEIDSTETVGELEVETKPVSTVTEPPKPKPQAPIVIPPIVEAESTELTFDSSRILAAHNVARKEVGLPPLTYSKTLAQSAQKWSDELQRDNCEMRHDANTDYGENLYWASRTGGEIKNELVATPETVVDFWVSEKSDYNYGTNSCAPGKQCGHYTQIVWEETTEVGCAVSVCQNGDTQKDMWVCRYNPRGNYIGEKPY